MKRWWSIPLFAAIPGLALAGLITISGARGGGSSGSGDFDAICAAAIRCFTFDSDADFNTGAGGTQGAWGDNYGVLPINGTSTYRAVRDTSIKASGTSALRFDIPATAGSDTSGAWFTNFSDDLSFQVNEGEDVYIQWRYRMSAGILNVNYKQSDGTTNSDGLKMFDVGTGDLPSCNLGSAHSTICPTSCSDMEIVIQNLDQNEMPLMYTGCAGPAAFKPLYASGSNIIVQNGNGCLYPTFDTPPCFKYAEDEWMTFQVHIHIGTWNTYSSTIQMWGTREGGSKELLVECSPTYTPKCSNFVDSSGDNGWLIYNSDTGNYQLGKVWLLPYHTNRSASYTYTDTDVWYDNLVIDDALIPDYDL